MKATPSFTPDSSIPLTNYDKDQIMIEVLKQESPRQAKSDDTNGPRTIYVLREERLSQSVPKPEGIMIEYISEAEINAKRKEGEIAYSRNCYDHQLKLITRFESRLQAANAWYREQV